MSNQVLLWTGFNLFVIAMLFLDAAVFHRRSHAVKIKEALGWSIFWVSLAGIFNIGVYYFMGKEKALQFLAGYLIEESLSVDNLFVFLLVFSYFKVPQKYQHKVLFWGILGAQIMRAVFIICGVALLNKFHWVIYVFGLLLLVSGVKLVLHDPLDKEKGFDPEKNLILRLFRKFMPFTHSDESGNFFVRKDGKLYATTLFAVLIIIETTDLIFAVDSIPAVLAISRDPFIVYTSNVFAILGLRALYFALAGLMEMFHYMHYGLGAILVFVGFKMMAEDFIHVPIAVALGFIAGTLTLSIIVSLIAPVSKKRSAS